LIHQRRLTPSCGGLAPTAERTVGPARMFAESLTPSPGIENTIPSRPDICALMSTRLKLVRGTPTVANSIGCNPPPTLMRTIKPSPASSPLCRQVCVRRGHLDLPWPGRAVGVADALGGRRPAEPLLPHLTSAKLAGRHFEAGQKLDIALIASSGALADAGVPV